MKVSTYRKEITPTQYFPCYLSGHAIRTEKAIGIMDSLWTTSIVLDVDNTKLVWISVELIGLEKNFTDEIRNEISKKYDVDFDLIHVNYVHTHSAPEYQEVNFFGGPGCVSGYMDFVKDQILDCVQSCFEQEQIDVEAYYDTVMLEGCYSNRNGIDKPCDKSVTTIEFRNNQNEVVAGLCNFTCHSTVLGPQNLMVSSDLAGYVARYCMSKWNVYPVIVIGAAGDMSNRYFRLGNDAKELNRIGEEMMSQVFYEGRKPKKLNLEKVSYHHFSYRATYFPVLEQKQKQYDEIKLKVENAQSYDEKKTYTSALAIAKKGLECKPYDLDLECAYVCLGDLRYFVIPAELFSRFGIEIKKAMDCACPILWGYCNYSVGYLGNIEDYGASFETASSDIPKGTTEKIVSEIMDFIKDCEV